MERIQRGRQIGFENMLLIQNIYYALTQLGFYDKLLYDVLDRHGFHTEANIRQRYLSTAKYILSIYNPGYDIQLLVRDTNKIRKIHGSVNDTITQQMYHDVLLVFCAPIYFFDLYGVHLSNEDKICFIELWTFLGRELGIKQNVHSSDDLYPKINRLINNYVELNDGTNKIHKLFVKHVYVPFMFIKPNEIFVVNSLLKFICSFTMLMRIVNWLMRLVYS